jgi:hypothetical protein
MKREEETDYCVGLWRKNERGEGKITLNLCDFTLSYYLFNTTIPQN